MIKASILQHFVRDWLTVRGIVPQTIETDVWTFPVPKDLRERLGSSELAFSFNQRALSRHPRSELATVGNPVFDRFLGVAREEGRVGIAFTQPKSPAARPPTLAKAGNLGGVTASKAEPVYQAIYHFVFTISYPSIEAADEMEVVSVDGGTLEVLAQTPDLSDLWGKLEREPQKGRCTIPAMPLPERVIDASLAAFERRMRRRINKVVATSVAHLDEETRSIKGYYEQLIEEARNQSRRWSTRVEEREDRVQWLQLEWKRRIGEATEFWRPRVTARLVALGIQMMPRVAYRYGSARGAGKGGARACCRMWDESSRSFLAPYCADCGKTGLEGGVPRQGVGILCQDCAAKPRLVPPVDPPPTKAKRGRPRREEADPALATSYPPLTLVKKGG